MADAQEQTGGTDEKDDSQKQFELSAFVTDVEQPKDLKKDTNLLLNIQIATSEGLWTVRRNFKEFQVFHANLILNENYRGINLPKLPERKTGNFQGTIEDYLSLKRKEYTEYLNSILRRSFLLGSKSCQEFIDAPTKIRRLAKHISQYQSIPLRSGQMKKEGEKVRNWKSRYFVLFPNYLLRYYESQKTYRDGMSPKGSIDLTLARKILVYDETLNPFSFGISTPQRIWKIQCEKQSERDEWVVALRQLLQSEDSNAYIPDYSQNIANLEKYHPKEPEIQQGQRGHSESTTNQISKMQEQLNQVLQSTALEKEQIKHELNQTHKQQLQQTREAMLEFKSQVEELANELVEYETKITDLSEKIVELQQESNDKQENITQLEAEIETLNNKLTSNQLIIDNQKQIIENNTATMGTMQKELTEYKLKEEQKTDDTNVDNVSQYIENKLLKYTGETDAKLKLGKKPVLKKCVYLKASNTLIWRDANGDASKFMTVSKVTTKDAHITSQITYSNSWFKVTGNNRIALFASESDKIRNQWVDYIQECLSEVNQNAKK